MTEWTTIRVQQDAKDDAETRKPEDVSWSEWIKGERDDELEPLVDYTEIERRVERVLERWSQ